MASVASDFQKVISEARERRKNEALADKIFTRGRRQSAPSKFKPVPGPSLASRVGVNKRVAPLNTNSSSRRASVPAGNIDGEWTHDLHTPLDRRHAQPARARDAAPRTRAASRRISRLAAAVDRMDLDQVNILDPHGISIKGAAGPFAVLAQNFAPGTTAADIESAFTPISGEMLSCRIIKTNPFILAELLFASRDNGQRVIDMFNDKPADGRLLKVYAKPGGYQPLSSSTRNSPPSEAPRGPRSTRNTRPSVAYGPMSSDLMDVDNNSSSNFSRPLYSERIMSRRGRGWQDGR
ncbi:hypothetical protein CDD81_6909 [Ophiocordyceps australis]|uniref:RRM domain-containing protein n=1 Tax=Ophiocordyceps australis TaxID=1399860 RepID=A0A2C5Y4E9_9HYPO|nr:hypothetical protein CDD81_6909 [Ophiocordyceps australis]